jgi:hypothetical protein
MGLKGYRLWVMGYGLWVMGYGLWVNLIQRAEPHRERGVRLFDLEPERGGADVPPAVALQVAFERTTLKPVFSLDRF